MNDATITLHAITAENWSECAELTVAPGQRSFIVPNVSSIAAAQLYPESRCVAVYAGDRMVGFAMYGIEQPTGRVKLFRLMIAAEHQGRGYGTAALRLLLAEISSHWAGVPIFVSYRSSNASARGLYVSMGFREMAFDGSKATARR